MKVGAITSVNFFGNENFVIGKVMRGGMGTVYQLVPIRNDARPVALKTLQNIVSEQQFERECNAWLSVAQHDNIARAWAFGKWDGSPAIIADWYPRSMAELAFAECSDDYIINVVRGIISALNFAYNTAGLVHQDIKPANILIDKYGEARLSDFGLARCITNVNSGRRSTQRYTNELISQTTWLPSSTPFYMAPELFRGATPSLKTDLFSLGVTLFEFLTREHPYVGPETNGRYLPRLRYAVLAKAVSLRGPSFGSLPELVCKCLSLEPSQRPESYQATGWINAKSIVQKKRRTRISL